MSKHHSNQTRPTLSKGGGAMPSIAVRQHNLGPHLNLQRDASGSDSREPIDKSAVTEVLQSPGRPLDASTRAMMEPRFGYDFSRVRVHTDAQAARSAEAVHANAYTAGQNVVFGAGRYAPGSSQGQQLMAHELTHVVQQASGPVTSTPVANGISLSNPGDVHERSAHANAMSMNAAGPTNSALQQRSGTPELRALPSAASTGPLHLQRSAADDATVASSVFAGIGAAAGVVSTVFAGQSAAAAGRQADAAEAASVGAATSGGLVINHADVPPSASTSAAIAAESTPGARPTGGAEIERPTIPLLRIGIGEANDDFALIGVALRTKGNKITGGQTETIESNGYIGGLAGNNLFVQLRVRSAPPVNGKEVTRIEYEGNNNSARRGSSSQIQRFNGVIKVNAETAVVNQPKDDAHVRGGNPVQAPAAGANLVPLRITMSPASR